MDGFRCAYDRAQHEHSVTSRAQSSAVFEASARRGCEYWPPRMLSMTVSLGGLEFIGLAQSAARQPEVVQHDMNRDNKGAGGQRWCLTTQTLHSTMLIQCTGRTRCSDQTACTLSSIPVSVMPIPVVTTMLVWDIGVSAVPVARHAWRFGTAWHLAKAVGIRRRVRTVIGHTLRH